MIGTNPKLRLNITRTWRGKRVLYIEKLVTGPQIPGAPWPYWEPAKLHDVCDFDLSESKLKLCAGQLQKGRDENGKIQGT